MAVQMRLKRIGRRGKPFYRVVVTEAGSPRDGRFVEELGSYNPHAEEDKLVVNRERVDYWLGQGCQPSDTVRTLLKKAPLVSAS